MTIPRESNKDFYKKTFMNLCASNHISSNWVTKRQAVKYRHQKGRVYLTIKQGKDQSFGRE